MLFRLPLARFGTAFVRLVWLFGLFALSACSEPAHDDAEPAYQPPPSPPPIDTNCFAAGTLIATPDGSVPIERLELGQSVWSFDHATQAVVEGRVTARLARAQQPYGTFVVPVDARGSASGQDGDAGVVLKLTADHPTFARDDYYKVKCVRAGDALRVLSDAGVTTLAATSGFVPVPDASVDVYNLSVSPQPNYFAGGLLVHNKQACISSGGGGSCGWSGCPCQDSCVWWNCGGPRCPCPDGAVRGPEAAAPVVGMAPQVPDAGNECDPVHSTDAGASH